MNFVVPESRCELLALCDGHVVKQLIERPSRNVATLVPLLQADQYTELCLSNAMAKRFDNLLRQAYQEALVSNLRFTLDQYEGYEIVNGNSSPIPKGTILSSTKGFLERIPATKVNCINPISVLEKTPLCKTNRIMVGVCRFANHSCIPNCDYVASEYRGRKCVKLKLIKDCPPGEPLTVSYGPHFFDEGNRNCRCPFVEKHSSSVTNHTQQSTPRRYIHVKDSALSSRNLKRRVLFRRQNKRRRKRKIDLRASVPTESSSDGSFHNKSERIFLDSTLGSLSSLSEAARVPSFSNEMLHSSPLEGSTPSSTLTSFWSSNDEKADAFCRVHPSSNVSLQNFLTACNLIIAKHGTSDVEASDWLRLMRESSPGCHIPSYKTEKQKSRDLFQSNIKLRGKDECGEWRLLDFTRKLKEIVQSNIEKIWEFETGRDVDCDVQLPNFFSVEKGTLIVYTILNSDGVRVVTSDNKSLWPVWLGIANLPPILRSSFNNIVLAALWFGSKKPT